MKVFCDFYEFKNLIKDAKNPENPSCIDLVLTNNPNSFQNSGVIETGLSDFHKMTVTVMKTSFEKLKPNIISRLSTENIRVDYNGMEKFLQKKKYSRGNNMPFINKTIKKPLWREVV